LRRPAFLQLRKKKSRASIWDEIVGGKACSTGGQQKLCTANKGRGSSEHQTAPEVDIKKRPLGECVEEPGDRRTGR